MTTQERIAKTVDYRYGTKGEAAWERNRSMGMPESANWFAAIMTSTQLRTYEKIMAVYDGIGPELNARRCGVVA
jgi:hypothetical protein